MDSLGLILGLLAGAIVLVAVIGYAVARHRSATRPQVEPRTDPHSSMPAVQDAVGGAAAEPGIEAPSSPTGRMHRLRGRLARSNHAMGRGLLALLGRESIDQATWTAGMLECGSVRGSTWGRVALRWRA
ncbi:MAG: hypothetical protein ACKOE2_11925, partial [Actinomycetales bacterium]